MPIDSSYALRDTLERLRQRYALHFYLPEGVRAGEERNIQLDLTSAALRRYPGAQVHYRQVYMAPGGSSGSGDIITVSNTSERSNSAGDPDSQSGWHTATGRDTAPPSDDDHPVLRRRPAVDQDSGSHNGPLIAGPDSDNSAPPPQEPAPAPQAPAAGSDNSQSGPGWHRPTDADVNPGNSTGGWRTAKPDEK
jgi:hypothetical protein